MLFTISLFIIFAALIFLGGPVIKFITVVFFSLMWGVSAYIASYFIMQIFAPDKIPAGVGVFEGPLFYVVTGLFTIWALPRMFNIFYSKDNII